MTDTVDIDGTVASLAAARQAKAGRSTKSLLPSPAPTTADRGELAGWLTGALGLAGDPVVNAEQYGRHEDARLVVVRQSGQRITFERAADAFDPPRLVRVVMIATGAQLPPYGRGDVLHIAGSIIRLAELLVEDDARGEAVEWGRGFLTGADRNTHSIADFATASGRWEALDFLSAWRPPLDLSPYAPAAEKAALIVDTTSGTRYVRTSDFAAHVRGATHGISWSAMHGRMAEVGWLHVGEVQQRQPRGAGKRKAHLYAIPAGWETR